jgi:protein-tyrosine phosphatase
VSGAKRTSRGSDRYEIAVVCTGNRFRSPLVEALLRRATEGLPVRIRSFGTLDLGAAPALPEALAAATRLGLDLSSHRTSTLGHAPLAEADLVLGFERAHVVRAVVDAGAPAERTFTLPELVERLEAVDEPVDEDPIARARTLVAAAHSARPLAKGLPRVTELADPLGRGDRVFRETEAKLAEQTRRLAERLFGRRPD